MKRSVIAVVWSLCTIILYGCSGNAMSDRTTRAQPPNKDFMSLDPKVVFMGNSITEGWAYHYPECFAAHPNWINRGVSGQTTAQMLARYQQDVLFEKPAAVFILAGINDIAGNGGPMTLDETFANIQQMAQLANQQNITVVIASVLPAFRFAWRPELRPAQHVVQLNERLRAFAKTNQYVYADYFTAMADARPGLRAGLHEDEVHPNRAGYKIMEPITEAAVMQALAKAK